MRRTEIGSLRVCIFFFAIFLAAGAVEDPTGKGVSFANFAVGLLLVVIAGISVNPGIVTRTIRRLGDWWYEMKRVERENPTFIYPAGVEHPGWKYREGPNGPAVK